MTVGLLEKESTGGANARVGFEYQDAYVLQNLPKWLSQSAFSHVVSEAVGDVEVCYFGRGGGVRRLMVEAKNHELTSTDFWTEVERFKLAHETSEHEFVRFALVCRSYNSKTSPFIAKLERLRGVGASYQSDSVILQSDRQDVIAWAKKQGIRDDLADFALLHVDFETYSAESADAAFAGEIAHHLSDIDLSGRKASQLRDHFKGHIAKSSRGPVYRKQLEADLCEVLAEDREAWLGSPSRVHLHSRDRMLGRLALPAEGFVGPARSSKVAADWQELSRDAHEVAEFLGRSTERRTIILDGRQGMSAACLLGHAFRATSRFTLHVKHNGAVYRTDVYDQAEGPFFNESLRDKAAPGEQGVVSIAFTTSVGTDLGLGVPSLAGLPTLVLDSGRAVASPEEMNVVVAEAKAALVRFRSERRLEVIHLFIKGPSAFSMLLGHRLNGVCKVQLYDWVDGAYRATALLDA
jgi:SMODS-associated and fused to various effectors sensor domain